MYFLSILFFISTIFLSPISSQNQTSEPFSIHLAIIVSNKAQWIPYTFYFLDKINYPKNKISISLHSDHNFDDTINLLEIWRLKNYNSYASIETYYNHTVPDFELSWEDQARHDRVLELREFGLNIARGKSVDFYAYMDADIFLTEPNIFHYLLETLEWDWIIKAPLLKSPKTHSNFWADQNPETGWYKRNENYEKIYYQVDEDNNNKEVKGLFYVPVIHSFVFVNLRKEESLNLQFWPLVEPEKYPFEDKDELLVMNYNIRKSLGRDALIDNRYIYGYMPLRYADDSGSDYLVLAHLLSEILIEPPVGIDQIIKPTALPTSHVYPKHQSLLGFDKIYCINLKRRPDRLNRMVETFKLHGIGPITYPGAVDGHKITQKWLDDNGIAPLAGFIDPFHGRTLTKGEIGCFLSHWRLWLHQVKYGYEKILILEDDLRFEPAFNLISQRLMNDVEKVKPDWDLVYFGRKILASNDDEPFPEGATWFVENDYSYWTLGYALSLKGAKKLLSQAPLDRLVPVDEYLPIMYNKHHNEEIMKHFDDRTLQAYSAAPLLFYPTHYVGDKNYFSDTEKSSLWEKAKEFAPEGNDGTGFKQKTEDDDENESEKPETKEGFIANPDLSEIKMERLNYDKRFELDSVIKNFDKWESDMAFFCDNDRELEEAWAPEARIFEKSGGSSSSQKEEL